MRIAIWGAGKFGNYVKDQLKKNDKNTLVGFIDSNHDLKAKENDIEIMSSDQIPAKKIDRILIAVVDYISVFTQLKHIDFEINNVGIIDKVVYKEKRALSENICQDRYIRWLKRTDLYKPVLKTLETNVMDGCNLNCKGCSHFSNIFAQNEHVPFEIFRRDLKQIADHVFIAQLNLLGGEILLNDQLTDYLDYARNILPAARIEIVSNGLLIPKQTKTFFDCCRKNKIRISISGYRPTLAMKDKIIDTLKENNVDYIFRQDVLSFGKNIDLRGKADPRAAVKRCRESSCHFFRNGRLYKCPFEALGNHFFEHFNIDIHLSGGTCIYDSDLVWEELIDALNNEPVGACCYCGEEERMEWEIKNAPEKEDWII